MHNTLLNNIDKSTMAIESVFTYRIAWEMAYWSGSTAIKIR